MAARATPRGWHIHFYAPGTVVRDLLPYLADLEDQSSSTTWAYMLESRRTHDTDFERLLDLLRGGNCWIKLSGPYRIAKEKPLSTVAPLGRALVAAPSGNRLIWGPTGRTSPTPARHRRAAQPPRRLGP